LAIYGNVCLGICGWRKAQKEGWEMTTDLTALLERVRTAPIEDTPRLYQPSDPLKVVMLLASDRDALVAVVVKLYKPCECVNWEHYIKIMTSFLGFTHCPWCGHPISEEHNEPT
jgi:hypothetical protein